jgi:TPR repeat protein
MTLKINYSQRFFKAVTISLVLVAFAIFTGVSWAQEATLKSNSITETASGSPASGDEGVEVTPEALFAVMQVNAEKGEAPAMVNVGTMYERGIGVPRDFTKALDWYEKAAKAGAPDGYLRLGLCYEVGMGAATDMGKAVENISKAAELGSSEGKYKLASLYLQGRGVAKDEKKGISLLEESAASGNSFAANDLAGILINGLYGQKTNPPKAKEWLLKSAEAGNFEGIKNYAVMLKDGLSGDKPDPAEALKWYLVLEKAGAKGEELVNILAELKKVVPAPQAQKAENEATSWLEAKRKAMEPK